MHYIFFKPPFFSATMSGPEYCQLMSNDKATVGDIRTGIANAHKIELHSLRLLNIPVSVITGLNLHLVSLFTALAEK